MSGPMLGLVRCRTDTEGTWQLKRRLYTSLLDEASAATVPPALPLPFRPSLRSSHGRSYFVPQLSADTANNVVVRGRLFRISHALSSVTALPNDEKRREVIDGVRARMKALREWVEALAGAGAAQERLWEVKGKLEELNEALGRLES